jgi:hypothetical protein
LGSHLLWRAITKRLAEGDDSLGRRALEASRFLVNMPPVERERVREMWRLRRLLKECKRIEQRETVQV